VAKFGRGIRTPLVLVLLCVAAFLGVFIRPGLVDLGRASLTTSFDFHSYFLPRFTLSSLQLFHGHLPTWNPYEYGGIPLLATSQPAALYFPKALLFGLLPQEEALWTFLAIHYVLLAWFFLLFLRDQGLTGVPAYVGTALWVFASPILLSSYAPTRIANLVWMPLFFLFADRLGRGGGRRAFAGLALVVAVQFTAGYPEVAMDTALLLTVHATASWLVGRWPEPPWKTVPLLAMSFVVGAVAAAAQLIPLVELALVSHRDKLASVFRRDAVDVVHSLLTVIPGLIPFTLVGLFAPRARTAAAGMVTSWTIGMGGWVLLHRLPGFSMIRFPLAWVFLAGFFFAWLGALGCDAMLREDGLSRPARAVGLAITAGAGLFIAAAWGFHYFEAKHVAPKTELALYLAHPWAVVFGVTGGLGLVAATILTFRRQPNPTAWLVALVLLTLSHLAAYPFGGVPSPLRRPFPVGQIAMLHGRPRSIRGRVLSLEDLLYGYEITDKLPSLLGIEFSFLPHRARRLLDRLEFVPLFARIDWPKLTTAKGFLDAMDVEFMAAPPGLTPLMLGHGLAVARASTYMGLFYNPAHMGHAWVNYAVRRVHSEEEALDYVVGARFDPHHEVVLEEAPRTSFAERTTESVTRPFAEHRTSPTEVEFKVTLDRPGVFVVSESAYPGWEATVDGRESRWLQADYVLRAVELDAGSHRVLFEYRPASVRWGLRFSALGLAIIAALFLVKPKKVEPLPTR
jgi:hypothetical protein